MRIIGGRWRGRRLTPLEGLAIRPTSDRVREAWMSAMGGHFDGLRILDLFSGSGALGLECLSRGARAVTFVEQAAASLAVLDANIALVGAPPGQTVVVRRDALAWLGDPTHSGTEPKIDLALADPPYEGGWAQRVADRFAERPFAEELWLEHGSSERIRSPHLTRRRRYGGTALSTLVK